MILQNCCRTYALLGLLSEQVLVGWLEETGSACVILRTFLNELKSSLYFDPKILKIILAALDLRVLRETLGFLLTGMLNDILLNFYTAFLRQDMQRTLWIFTVSLTKIAAYFSCLCDDLIVNLSCCKPSRSLLPVHLLMTLNKGLQGPFFFGALPYTDRLSLSLVGMGYMEGSLISIFGERSSLGSVFMFLLLTTAEGSGDFLSDKIDGELGMGSRGMNLDDSSFLLTGLEVSFFVSSSVCCGLAGLLLQFLKTVDSPNALVLQFLLILDAPPSLLLQTAANSVGFSWTQVEASSLALQWNTICLLFAEGLECISDVFSYLIALMLEGRVFLGLLLGFDVGSLDLLDQFVCRGGGGLMGVYRGSSPLGRVKIGLRPSRLAVTLGSEMLERVEGAFSMLLSVGGEYGSGLVL